MKTLSIYNPKNLPEEELPYIIGFNNGGEDRWLTAVSIAEDGTVLGSHICSREGYMISDLCLWKDDTFKRKEGYAKHYPDGYRTTFISSGELAECEELNEAIALNQKNNPLPEGSYASVEAIIEK